MARSLKVTPRIKKGMAQEARKKFSLADLLAIENRVISQAKHCAKKKVDSYRKALKIVRDAIVLKKLLVKAEEGFGG